jgi:hypothetical protein
MTLRMETDAYDTLQFGHWGDVDTSESRHG